MNSTIRLNSLNDFRHIKSGSLVPILHRHNYSNATNFGATTMELLQDKHSIDNHSKSVVCKVKLKRRTINSNSSLSKIEKLPCSINKITLDAHRMTRNEKLIKFSPVRGKALLETTKTKASVMSIKRKYNFDVYIRDIYHINRYTYSLRPKYYTWKKKKLIHYRNYRLENNKSEIHTTLPPLHSL